MMETILDITPNQPAQSEQETQAPIGQEAIVPEQKQASWIDGLPDDLKAKPTLQKFKDVEDIVRSYVSLESMLGKDRLIVPSEESAQADWDNFYNKLGRPETPDGYELKLPDNIPVDEGFVNNFKQWAHSVGLSKKQTAELAKKYAEFESQMVAQTQEEINKNIMEAAESLKKDWGTEYEANVERANAALSTAAAEIPELIEWLNASNILADPVFAKILNFFGRGLSEDTLRGGRATTPQGTAEAKLNELFSDSDFKKKYLGGDAGAVQLVSGLMRQAYNNSNSEL